MSWNACGITSFGKLSSLQAFVYRHHPQVIFIQEAFVGQGENRQAPSLTGYVSYSHHVRNGLVTYIHSSLQHRLLRTSTDADTTFQLFEVTVGNGTIQACNVYCAPGNLHVPVLPPPSGQGMVYMGDFNARHPDLGDLSTLNRNGHQLKRYIQCNHLTRWDVGGATHARGGTLDHIITSGLVAARVSCASIPALFSDHVALSFRYTVPVPQRSPHHRLRITIPPKYCPNYIAYVSTLLPTFDLMSPDELYSSLVDATHSFFTKYVLRPHLCRRGEASSWTLDERILQAERTALQDGLSFQADPTVANLHRYRASRDVLVHMQGCVRTESWQQFTDGINQQTSVGKMWHLIQRTLRRKPPSALHHSPGEFAQQLLDDWSAQSRVRSLPQTVQADLSLQHHHRTLRLMSALLEEDDEDATPITVDELRRALARGKATAPGEDGVTYSVLRLLHQVPGNPLLRLYNLCYSLGKVPAAWTHSLIIPIPKPATDKFRPVSLTSCFSKVMERILLTRLLFRLGPVLSPRLFGFLPQRSTHHCLLDLYARLSPGSVVAFIDLKSAFDVANRDVILDQLVDFGLRGSLLRWIRGYLRNRTSRVLYKGACSDTRGFELGTPQGGILSPFLFNILMHRVLSQLPDVPGTTITCYADDICVHSTSPYSLQYLLDSFSSSASACGLIISSEKSRIFSLRDPRGLPQFTIGHRLVPLCRQYLYLGAPVSLPRATPAQRHHPVVQDLLDRLHRRLAPLKWLVNNSTGISIPVARTVYIAFIRSVIDYLSPALIQLPPSSLEPLEKLQNQAMRVILGCPMSTRVVNMLTELNLPPIIDRIRSMVTRFTLKCLHYPHIAPHYSRTVRDALPPRPRIPPLLPGGRTLIKAVSSILLRLNMDVPEAELFPGPPPWLLPTPQVSYTLVSTSVLPAIQRQLALAAIATMTSADPALPRVYTDGSVQPDGTAGCAVFSPDLDPPPGGWVGRRLPDCSSSTYCELYGILHAVSLICQRGTKALVICDSKSALQALSSPKPGSAVVFRILSFLALMSQRALLLHFLWIPSHIDISYSDTVDKLAKAACRLPRRGGGPSPSLSCHLARVRKHSFLSTSQQRDLQRAHSVSIHHYDSFRHHRYKYRRRGLMVRRHNVVAARLRLGYRPVWQVAGVDGEPPYTACLLCHEPRANTLEHYCLLCPVVQPLLPHNQPLVTVCRHLLHHEALDELLLRFPQFCGFH